MYIRRKCNIKLMNQDIIKINVIDSEMYRTMTSTDSKTEDAKRRNTCGYKQQHAI